MARRRRRRKSSYEQSTPGDTGLSQVALEELSPRARRLVEGGVIDVETVVGSGENGKITSGDILHAARIMEVEQSVARIEVTQPGSNGGPDDSVAPEADPGPSPDDPVMIDAVPDLLSSAPGTDSGDDPEDEQPEDSGEEPAEAAKTNESGSESATFTSVHVGGEPIAEEPSPWEDYNGSTDGFSGLAREGAEQSWGEAEAHLTAMEQEAAPPPVPAPATPPAEYPSAEIQEEVQEPATSAPEPPPAPEPIAPVIAHVGQAMKEDVDGVAVDDSDSAAVPEQVSAAQASREEMMDFGTLEHVDPESVWAQGAEDFAPWFLAHSQQLGAVLGLKAGLSDARQFTTKSATGVLGRDDNGEDVVVVSSKNAVADDSDLGRALGMAASSGAASVALVSAALHEDQLKALAWLNSQTKSGVKWYGIEMSVVRIADSPAAMLFDLVASPGQVAPATDLQEPMPGQ